jgi:hypothetical protein
MVDGAGGAELQPRLEGRVGRSGDEGEVEPQPKRGKKASHATGVATGHALDLEFCFLEGLCVGSTEGDMDDDPASTTRILPRPRHRRILHQQTM